MDYDAIVFFISDRLARDLTTIFQTKRVSLLRGIQFLLRSRATSFEPYLEDPRQRDEHEPKDVTRLFVEKLHLDAPQQRRSRVPRRRYSTNSAFVPACHGHPREGRLH